MKCSSKGHPRNSSICPPCSYQSQTRITLNICNQLNQEDTTIQSVSGRSSGMKDGLHRRRCTDSEERRQESLCDCSSVCDNDVLVCARSQVPIKVNKTNCYVSICGCFSSCCKFRCCTVYPTLFLVHVLVCLCVWVGLTVSFSPPWSMPGSEVITTELLCHSLMWFATQMRAHRHTHRHTGIQTKVKSRQTELTLKALCLRLLSLKALTAKEKKQGQGFAVLVSVL